MENLDTSNWVTSDIERYISNNIGVVNTTYSEIRIKLTNIKGIDFSRIDEWHNEYISFSEKAIIDAGNIRTYGVGLSGDNDRAFREIINQNNTYMTKLANIVSEQLIKDAYDPVNLNTTTE